MNMRQIHIFFKFSKAMQQSAWLLIIIMFCKGCEHGCEPDTVQKKLKQKMTQGNKQKQFHIHNHDSNFYKTHK